MLTFLHVSRADLFCCFPGEKYANEDVSLAPKIVIFAPFWKSPNHLSAVRVGRFIRWLGSAGWQVVLVRAGGVDAVISTPWGVEVAIRDPLGLHPEDPGTAAQRVKEYPSIITTAAFTIFTPDPGIVWARRAAKHPLVLQEGRGAGVVLSSNPPESAHLGASILASRFGAALYVDMRDGWLDEPLKPLLRDSPLQRWREARLERKVLSQARRIFVTSTGWETLLGARLPWCKDKITVLTNCYPEPLPPELVSRRYSSEVLFHAGQFTESKFNNRPSLLLKNLHPGLKKRLLSRKIILQGRLNQTDLSEIFSYKDTLSACDTDIEILPSADRTDVWKRMASAGGLLLLSATHASLLAKLFEYLPTRRPILAVTQRGSAIWDLSQRIPQMFAVDLDAPEGAVDIVTFFLDACEDDGHRSIVPGEFSEEYNKKVFLAELSDFS